MNKLNYHEFEHAAEFIHRCAKDVQLLDHVGDDLVGESQRTVCCEQDVIDHLEDNLLHGGEVEILHCQLCAVLNIDA